MPELSQSLGSENLRPIFERFLPNPTDPTKFWLNDEIVVHIIRVICSSADNISIVYSSAI